MIILTQLLETEQKFVNDEGEQIVKIEMRGVYHPEDVCDYTYTTLPTHEGCWMLEVFTFAQRSHIVGVFYSEEDVIAMINELESTEFYKKYSDIENVTIEEIACMIDIDIALITL